MVLFMAIIVAADLDNAFDSVRIDYLVDDGEGEDTATKDARIAAAIDRAEGTIKNVLSLNYTTTQIEADSGIKRICEVIAMYILEMRRSNYTAQLAAAYNDALSTLERLRSGEEKLAAVDQLLPSHATMEEVLGPLTRSEMFTGLPETGE